MGKLGGHIRALHFLLAASLVVSFAAAPNAAVTADSILSDGRCNVADLNGILAGMLDIEGATPRDDVNGDGEVDLLDYQALVYAALGETASEKVPQDNDDTAPDAVVAPRVSPAGKKLILAVSYVLPIRSVGQPAAGSEYPPERDGHVPPLLEQFLLLLHPNAPPESHLL